MLVLSKHHGSETLELVGLAGAVSKSILALFGFIVLESLKIVLYGRMMAGLDDALGHHERQHTSRRAFCRPLDTRGRCTDPGRQWEGRHGAGVGVPATTLTPHTCTTVRRRRLRRQVQTPFAPEVPCKTLRNAASGPVLSGAP